MVKKVGYAVYAHRSNIAEFFKNIPSDAWPFVTEVLNVKFCDYDIVKYDKSSGNVSLIRCSTWDYLNEPIVEDSFCFTPTFSYKVIKGGTKVYHNKWMFVSDDYKGFDIEEAKERTKLWNSIPNIKEYKSKIGNIDFWYKLLKENNIEI